MPLSSWSSLPRFSRRIESSQSPLFKSLRSRHPGDHSPDDRGPLLSGRLLPLLRCLSLASEHQDIPTTPLFFDCASAITRPRNVRTLRIGFVPLDTPPSSFPCCREGVDSRSPQSFSFFCVRHSFSLLVLQPMLSNERSLLRAPRSTLKPD